MDVRFDAGTNTITLSRGENISGPALSGAVDKPAILREVHPGEWLLSANVTVLSGASLQVSAPEVRWLKLASGDSGFVSIKAFGGVIHIEDSCIHHILERRLPEGRR
jgi:hypothetical protein